MAFSRLAMAKAKAASHDPEAEAWQQMLAKERAEQEAKEKAAIAAKPVAIDPGARAAADERRWKEAQENHIANFNAAKNEMQKPALSEEQARLARIQRSKEEAAKRATAGVGSGAPGRAEFAWKKQSPVGGGYSGASGKGGSTSKSLPSLAAAADLPGHDDCEIAISAMISRTVQGMREGLRQLGLPDFPLNFVPGQELVLCGHDLRESINEMIHAWMVEEKDEFYNALLRIKKIVQNPILTEEEMAFVQQRDEWQKIQTDEGRAIYMQKTAEAAGLGPRAKLKPDVPRDDSDDEVIDVTENTKPPSAALNFAKPAPAASTDEDYYALLGVPSTASFPEIRKNFRNLVATEHPEKGGDAAKFALLNKAYTTLSDQTKRKLYDEQRLA